MSYPDNFSWSRFERHHGLRDNECSCGSGNSKYALYDAQRIFVCYVCETCEDVKRAKYNPTIFTDYSEVEEPIDE